LRYGDGSDTLRRDQSSIEWRHEGFGFDKLASRGATVPGEPALWADGSAAGGGTNHRRFDDEAGRRSEDENGGDKDGGDEEEIDFWDGEGGSGVGEAQKACEPVWQDGRDTGEQGGKGGADSTHQTGFCCLN